MNKGLCVYPGSFDPVTLGHQDIIKRACDIFPEVIVAVLNNTDKNGSFPVEKRLELLEKSCGYLKNVKFDSFGGLLVDYIHKVNGATVLRGLRAVTDFESEFQMAQINRQIAPDVETLFLMTSPELSYVSSSAVRQIAYFGGDISPLVPKEIIDDIYKAYK